MIRSRASLFIAPGKIVFCLCGAGDGVIFDSKDSRCVIMDGHGWARVSALRRGGQAGR
jgi:hypothetical protein